MTKFLTALAQAKKMPEHPNRDIQRAIDVGLAEHSSLRQQVMAFHMLYDMPIRKQVSLNLDDVPTKEIALRIRLQTEEFIEWLSKGFGLGVEVRITSGALPSFTPDSYSMEAQWSSLQDPDDTMAMTEVSDAHANGLEGLIESHRPFINVIEIADASADQKYVLEGADLTFGIDSLAVSREVHGSNMTKAGEDGLPIKRADGKLLKGPYYMEPQLDRVVLIRHTRKEE